MIDRFCKGLITYEIYCSNIVCFLIPLSADAGTQGIVEGKIRDAATKEFIVSVKMQIAGTTMGTVSDIEGYYVIRNIRAGVYDLKFTLLGYKTVTTEQMRC